MKFKKLNTRNQYKNRTVAANISKTSGTGATLTLKAMGNITVNTNCSIISSSNALNIVFWSDSDNYIGGFVYLNTPTTITTNGGHLWIGGGSGTTTWNSLSVGNDYAKNTSGYHGVTLDHATISTSGGEIQIKGESTSTNKSSFGININYGDLNAGSGNISLYGKGGYATGTQANCTGIRVSGPITTTTGNITLTGTSTTQDWCEGIAMHLADITSTSGNISLSTNRFYMQPDRRIRSSWTLTLKPLTDVSTIGIAGGAGTMYLPDDYFTTKFVNEFSGITIGSGTAGNIGIKAIRQ